MTFLVTVPSLSARFEVGDDETIVEAAIRHNVAFPFSCHSGTCGTCKSQLISGKIKLLDYSKFTLTDEERATGLILACCAIPQSDCEVAPAPEASPIPAQRLVCNVASIEPVTYDIKILRLECPGGTPPRFLAGQFANLTLANLPTRSYSMANRPGEPLLEFHIRLMPNGKVSTFVHEQLSVGSCIEFRGPLGSSYLRNEHTGPILALAGGSGLGPIKSIIDTALESGTTAPIHFYFGIRDERDLYFAEHFQELERRFKNLRFTPVLSQPSDVTGRRTGFLADVIKADFQNFTGFKAYLAGPPIMIDTSLAVLKSRGLALADFHADAF